MKIIGKMIGLTLVNVIVYSVNANEGQDELFLIRQENKGASNGQDILVVPNFNQGGEYDIDK